MNRAKLMLGTVQFGLNYGIANRDGQVPYDQVLEILHYAHQQGLRYLDTAAAYGNAEERLGKALEELKLDFNIVSKIPPLPEGTGDPAVFIRDSLQRSLQRLRQNGIYGCLFHNEQDSVHADKLLEMKHQGLLQHCGVSLDSLAHPEIPADFELLQLPYNILDRRFEHMLKKPGIKKFARSAFLQGLLLQEEFPEQLQGLHRARRGFERIRLDTGLERQQFYMLYVLSKPEVNLLVFGVDSLAQLKQNIAIAKMPPLSADIMLQIEALRVPLPESLLRPAMWKN